jgi:dihydrofolate synthase/folylpolyglutamate synthase
LTNVDFDHQDYLGNTLLEIGYEKAGIIKKDVPLFSGVTQEPVIRLIQKTAESVGTFYYRLGVDFRYCARDSINCFSNSFDFHGMKESLMNLSLPLLGEHQVRNASLALGALEFLHDRGFPQYEEAKRRGLKEVRWPGRIELIRKDPLFLLDGAHNPAGALTLARFLASLPPAGKRFLVLGIMKDKDIYSIGEKLIPWADELVLTQASYSRAASPDELQRNLPATFKRTVKLGTLAEVFRYLDIHAEKGDQVCVTGSLYTIGEAKAISEGIPIDVPLHG